MKLIFIISLFLILLSCKKRNIKKNNIQNTTAKEVFIVKNDSINEEFLKRVIYDTAIFYNNLPVSNLDYKLNEIYAVHFRLNLGKFYSDSDLKKPIPIKETTWEYDDENFITVWYRKDNGIFTPFDTFIYFKYTLF